jgi:hypothetical protein
MFSRTCERRRHASSLVELDADNSEPDRFDRPGSGTELLRRAVSVTHIGNWYHCREACRDQGNYSTATAHCEKDELKDISEGNAQEKRGPPR